jgi:hypothetical protein
LSKQKASHVATFGMHKELAPSSGAFCQHHPALTGC